MRDHDEQTLMAAACSCPGADRVARSGAGPLYVTCVHIKDQSCKVLQIRPTNTEDSHQPFFL